MSHHIELLAPGGDLDSIKAAILAGANAVYCGLDRFNARNRATNIGFDDLQGILHLAHHHDCHVFLTLNIIILESEVPALFTLLNKLVNTTIDALIVQDLGLLYILQTYFPTLHVHASTQMTTHNRGQVAFLKKLGVDRVNLSRELTMKEIAALTDVAHSYNIETEVFVHGSNCISFSGLCYMSSLNEGNSGNRGRCSQPCRDKYETTDAGIDFPLNLKDNSAFFDIDTLIEAGVDSLKIEGRIKKFHYVSTVVGTWRKHLDHFEKSGEIDSDNSHLYKVFNRDFSNTLLSGENHKSMFIDNPRDNSALNRAKQNGDDNLERAKRELYDEKTEIIQRVQTEIDTISIQKVALKIIVSGKENAPLTFIVKSESTLFEISSESSLRVTRKTNQMITSELLRKRFKAINDTEYFIDILNTEALDSHLSISFKELTHLKKKILFFLLGHRDFIESTEVPRLLHHKEEQKPKLTVLISSFQAIALCHDSDTDYYFELPNRIGAKLDTYVELFQENPISPYFPALLIGDDYDDALELLSRISPDKIITNNSGIALYAFENDIAWAAGPHMNLVNSFALLSLKEHFNCRGAFVSNEIKRQQIKSIKRPDNFELFYSIYHPIVLMTTSQCLFHQVTSCTKHRLDETCISQCEKISSITNMKGETFIIEKSAGNLHRVYNSQNFLNTEIITEVPEQFSHFMVDLREIKTGTQCTSTPENLIHSFQEGHTSLLHQKCTNTTDSQYRNGL